MIGSDVLDRVLAAEPPAFAIIHRPAAVGPSWLEVLVGEIDHCASLEDLDQPAPGGSPGEARHETLALIPFRQISERGFDCVDDGEPLVKMRVLEQGNLYVDEVLARLPLLAIELDEEGFDVDDEGYAAAVRQLVAEEIGRGEGANFVLKRSHCATIRDYTPGHALAVFRRLLEQEMGAHWTFVVHTGERTFVGATPERHLTLQSGKLTMNPISGTYRYPPSGPTLDGILAFLADVKESDELYMVVDEELKMMARLCVTAPRLTGPHLREMARLAHTEYFIEGQTSRGIPELLRETMFAPTVVGSPLESACRVVRRYEPDGRAYYAGVIALSGRDACGHPSLDSAILIRTADIDGRGRTRITAGATIVRHSDPEAEAAETRAKVSGLVGALRGTTQRRYGDHPAVTDVLARRNDRVAKFWCGDEDTLGVPATPLAGQRALVVDAEDNFTFMLGRQLQALGLAVSVKRLDEPYHVDDFDLVVMGPGPGSPVDVGDIKIAQLRRALSGLLARHKPFLSVCLSHQVLSGLLGLRLERRRMPNQGVRKEINYFGRPVLVGFYNAFSARCPSSRFEAPDVGGAIEVCRDPATAEVHALRGPNFYSLQFHPESVLSLDGPGILRALATELLAGAEPSRRRQRSA